jgi:hypothetical protein
VTPTKSSPRRPVRQEWRLWFSVFAPAAAWIVAQQASFLLTPWICTTGRRWVLYLVTGAASLAAIAGALAAWSSWRKLPPNGEGKDPARTRRRFMAAGGLLLGVFFLMAILAFAIPDLVHRPCD